MRINSRWVAAGVFIAMLVLLGLAAAETDLETGGGYRHRPCSRSCASCRRDRYLLTPHLGDWGS